MMSITFFDNYNAETIYLSHYKKYLVMIMKEKRRVKDN
ncbi:Putative uncharacterized protein [Moritella viscosa]|nr:Putative uncharacterized protein [Moritella viscosa]